MGESIERRRSIGERFDHILLVTVGVGMAALGVLFLMSKLTSIAWALGAVAVSVVAGVAGGLFFGRHVADAPRGGRPLVSGGVRVGVMAAGLVAFGLLLILPIVAAIKAQWANGGPVPPPPPPPPPSPKVQIVNYRDYLAILEQKIDAEKELNALLAAVGEARSKAQAVEASMAEFRKLKEEVAKRVPPRNDLMSKVDEELKLREDGIAKPLKEDVLAKLDAIEKQTKEVLVSVSTAKRPKEDDRPALDRYVFLRADAALQARDATGKTKAGFSRLDEWKKVIDDAVKRYRAALDAPPPPKLPPAPLPTPPKPDLPDPPNPKGRVRDPDKIAGDSHDTWDDIGNFFGWGDTVYKNADGGAAAQIATGGSSPTVQQATNYGDTIASDEEFNNWIAQQNEWARASLADKRWSQQEYEKTTAALREAVAARVAKKPELAPDPEVASIIGAIVSTDPKDAKPQFKDHPSGGKSATYLKNEGQFASAQQKEQMRAALLRLPDNAQGALYDRWWTNGFRNVNVFRP